MCIEKSFEKVQTPILQLYASRLVKQFGRLGSQIIKRLMTPRPLATSPVQPFDSFAGVGCDTFLEALLEELLA